MKTLFSICTLITVIIGCQSANTGKTPLEQEKKAGGDSLQASAIVYDTLTTASPVNYPVASIGWSDSILLTYTAFSENELIRLARKDHLKEEWLLDSTLQTDTAVYQIYQIGHDVADEGSENQRFVTDRWVYLDTLKRQLYEYDLPNESLNKWTYDDHRNLFYPVYELSPRTTAFVVNFSDLGERHGFLDKIFDQISQTDSIGKMFEIPKGCKLYDNSGAFKLIKSDKLEAEIRKYFDREFYVYGTRGYTKTKIKDIVYALDECRTNFFAFCLEKSTIRSIGHPVFCSDKLIDLTYANDYSNIEKGIGKYNSQIPSDYSDSIKTKVLGNVGDLYFTYNDDFLWGRKHGKTKCKFPARGIYWAETKSSVINYWEVGLDLFGIPCD